MLFIKVDNKQSHESTINVSFRLYLFNETAFTCLGSFNQFSVYNCTYTPSIRTDGVALELQCDAIQNVKVFNV